MEVAAVALVFLAIVAYYAFDHHIKEKNRLLLEKHDLRYWRSENGMMRVDFSKMTMEYQLSTFSPDNLTVATEHHKVSREDGKGFAIETSTVWDGVDADHFNEREALAAKYLAGDGTEQELKAIRFKLEHQPGGTRLLTPPELKPFDRDTAQLIETAYQRYVHQG